MVMIIDIIKITMITTISSCRRIVLHHRHLERHRREQEREREKPKNGLRHEVNLANIIFIIIIMGCTQNPISTLSHIWVFVRLYGIMFVIIVTRPKPAYGRQGLAGSWGQDTDKVSTFLGVFNVSLRACGAQLGFRPT